MSKDLIQLPEWGYDEEGKVVTDYLNCITKDPLTFFPICGAVCVDEERNPIEDIEIGYNKQTKMLEIPRKSKDSRQRACTIRKRNSNSVDSNELLKISYGEKEIELDCDQDVVFNSYYDVLVYNDTGEVKQDIAPNLFSHVSIDGVDGNQNPDHILTFSDAPADELNFPGVFRLGEQNKAGNTSVRVSEGKHKIEFFVELWQLSEVEDVRYLLSQGNLTASWVESFWK